ncbi:hypothetical protein WJ03_10440 [Burkholderia vietnamiensis]|nr:hypothetical protein WJ03_10440 [Burkholderia vietnamiensis]
MVVGIRAQHCEAVRRTATNRHAGQYASRDRADAHAIVATRWRVKYGCRRRCRCVDLKANVQPC